MNDAKSTLTQVFYPFEEINFLLLLLIFGVAVVMTLFVQRVLPRIAEVTPARFRHYLLPLVPIFRLLILVVAVATAAPLLVRPTIQNFVALFGAAGLAIGFAFKDYIGSLIAGIVTIYERPYGLGDRITIGDAYGEVKSIGLRSLQVLTADDTLVTIPHSRIWDTNIHNANAGHRGQLCVADFYLHPDHDANAARQTLMDVIITSPYLQIKQPVAVMVSEKPWGTHYRLKAYPIEGRDEFSFVTDMTVRGKEALRSIGANQISLPVLPR